MLSHMILALAAAQTAAQCGDFERRQISYCALPLSQNNINQHAELLLLQYDYSNKFTFNPTCVYYQNFQRCAASHLNECLTSPLRYNYYLISSALWNSFCNEEPLIVNSAWSCLRNLEGLAGIETCRNITKQKSVEVVNYLEVDPSNTCDFVYSQYACLSDLSSKHCAPEATSLFSRTFSTTKDIYLPHCTFPPTSPLVDKEPSATAAWTWGLIGVLIAIVAIFLVIAIIFGVRAYKKRRSDKLILDHSRYIYQFDDGTLYI